MRGERVVRARRAVLDGRPQPAVAGEVRGRAHHVQVLAVPEDDPDRHVVVEQYGGDGAVFGAELLVQGAESSSASGP